ncbi:MAG: CPBP family intramembrane metalloprotease [Candidatus Omnitrophica bacterium]|nr:CPBP family intramembrane metalloprotease [Candidatus Omnitrophota bacterium]
MNNIKQLTIWLTLGILGLAVFVFFYEHASPTASIDIQVDKKEAVEKAARFINELGFDLAGYDKTVIFHSDYYASVYLQKTQGIKETNRLIREGVPVWFWRVRYFKELEKEGFYVDVDPASGEIVNFYYSLLEDKQGANLSEREARAIAEQRIALEAIGLGDYTLKDSTRKEQKRRTDYHFNWEKKDYKIEEATLRISVDVYGNKLGRYRRYLKVPEEFSRYLERETSLGQVLAIASSIFTFILLIAAIFMLFSHFKQSNIDWKFALIFASLVAPLEILDFLNRMPLLWNFYPDTISKAMFVMITLERALITTFSVTLLVFACAAVGELISRDLWGTKIPLINAIKNQDFSASRIAAKYIVGYSLGFIFLGYVSVFYIIGAKFFNIWMLPNTHYSNILGMRIPVLFPLTFAVAAAVKEEVTYRFFGISFLKKGIKSGWLAVLIPALIWGFAHSDYAVFPNYVRGIELTIFGVALGMVFLKYGLLTVIIAHFVIDAVFAGLPLIKSHNPYFVASGIIVVLLIFLPLLIVPLSRFIKTKRRMR